MAASKPLVLTTLFFLLLSRRGQELSQPLADVKAQLDATAFDIQFFISEHAQDLSPEQSRQLLRLLNELQRSFQELSERRATRAEVLRVCLQQAEQTDQVTVVARPPLCRTALNQEQPLCVSLCCLLCTSDAAD